mgnify:FL=1
MEKINDDLRSFINEVIKASPEYMEKEKIRERLQMVVTDLVRSGKISDQESLDDFFSTANMALNALKMVPLTAYVKLSKK